MKGFEELDFKSKLRTLDFIEKSIKDGTYPSLCIACAKYIQNNKYRFLEHASYCTYLYHFPELCEEVIEFAIRHSITYYTFRDGKNLNLHVDYFSIKVGYNNAIKVRLALIKRVKSKLLKYESK